LTLKLYKEHKKTSSCEQEEVEQMNFETLSLQVSKLTLRLKIYL